MKVLLACLLAAAISFGWGYVSWSVLTWHDNGMHDFKDEAAVAKVIKENTSHGYGIYMLPYQRQPLSIATAEEKRQMQAEYEKARVDGPYFYGIVRPGKSDWTMTNALIFSAARSFIACFIVAMLLRLTTMTYLGRVFFTASLGLFAGLAVDVPTWAWFQLPTRDLIVNLADHFIEWMLVGFVLGLFVGRTPTAADYR